MLRTKVPISHSSKSATPNSTFQLRSYSEQTSSKSSLKRTPLHDLHVELGGKMVDFAGYELPLRYNETIMASHLHCREKASLFDVSHMGQVQVYGANRVEFLEKLVPGTIQELKEGRCRLTQFTNEKGGILDDTVITNKGDHHYMVLNAANVDSDMEHFAKHWAEFALHQKEVQVDLLEDRALMALQGPLAAEILQGHLESGIDLKDMAFMTSINAKVDGVPCVVTRCGYTGEDGFEVSVPDNDAEKIARALLSHSDVQPAGLGARDSLRLEAGLCLMGHDMTPETTPVEADLAWTIGKRRREEGGFLGDDVILDQLKNGPPRKRVGFTVKQGPPAREGYRILSAETDEPIGQVTSGVYSPCLKQSVGMGYVSAALAHPDTSVHIDVRGRHVPAVLSAMPFVPHRFYRKPKKSAKK